MRKYDTRDADEHVAVRAILDVLAEDHPARLAYAAGATTIELSHRVGNR
jgi:hypothetical protein